MNIYEEARVFAAEVNEFVAENQLPRWWFGAPDHVAVKTNNALDYDQLVAELLGISSHFAEARLDGRRLGAAVLLGERAVDVFGPHKICMVELMEPKPQKIGQSLVGLDHVEYRAPAAGPMYMSAVLESKRLDYEHRVDKHNESIIIPVGANGQEIKFSDRTIKVIVADELAQDQARLLKKNGVEWAEL